MICRPGNTKTGLTKQIRKPKSFSKRDTPATIVGLQKPDDQAATAAYRTACSTLQAKLRTMQNDWWRGVAERTQRYADMGDMHAFYEAPKAVYRPTHQIQAPLRFWDGSTLKTGKMLLVQRSRRAIQYCSVFHVPKYLFQRAESSSKADTMFTTRSISTGGKHAFDQSAQR